jgi:Rrf2 family protein
MIEFARMLRIEPIVNLGRIAKITGISTNYLAQLAIPLRNSGLLVGTAGKKGGYQLGRRPEDIHIGDVLVSLQGNVSITDCTLNPEICMNSSFCEARILWVIASHKMTEFFNEFTLADLVDKKWKEKIQKEYDFIPHLNPDEFLSSLADVERNCPTAPGS